MTSEPSPLAPDAGRRWASFEALGREIRACRRCPLGAVRTNAVVYRGGPRPRLVFVGEAPGAAEDAAGLPFVGRSGTVLDAAIARLPVEPLATGIVNVLKCRPPGNRFDRTAAATCRPFLDRQLALLAPEVVVSLGAWALRALDPEAPRVLAAAGRPRRRGDGGWLYPMLHPAATLRATRWRRRWDDDVAGLARWLDGAAR